jgi:hypothetical protein
MQGMQEMKTFWLRIALSIVVSMPYMQPALTAPSQSTSPCDESTVPTTISELLKAKFPQWRPKRLSDMDADNQQLWLEGRNGKECPGSAVGHFDSTDTLSYAFLLVPQSNPTGGYKVVMFGKAADKDHYSVHVLDGAEGQTYSGLVIFRAEPGEYKDVNGKRTVRIKTDVLYVEWIEKGAEIFYWSAGRYHELQVSD